MNRWPTILLILITVAAIGGIFLTRADVLAAPEQPIAYNHQTHVEAGVQCLYCHSSALTSDIASIPSVKKCMGCHSIIATDSPAIQKLRSHWENNEPITWARVNQQPEFVYFSHQAHLLNSVNCETCHGDVGRMEVVHQVVRMDMGWCLDCHLKQEEEKVPRLADCLACHK